MSRTQIPEKLIHNPGEVKKNAEFFDVVVKFFPTKLIGELVESQVKKLGIVESEKLTAMVEQIGAGTREQLASTWIESVRSNLQGGQKMTLAETLELVKGKDLYFNISYEEQGHKETIPFLFSDGLDDVLKKFSDSIAGAVDENPNGLPMPFNIVIKKEGN